LLGVFDGVFAGILAGVFGATLAAEAHVASVTVEGRAFFMSAQRKHLYSGAVVSPLCGRMVVVL
jgi:hypothetical protein